MTQGEFLQSKQSQSNSGTAAIGGAFTLTDHHGKTVTEKDFAGKYMLVFFGFTFCPDVCPTTLSFVSQLLDEIGEPAKQITPLFITIDPARDTAEMMASYVENFHPSIVGLTGTDEQIAAVTKAYKVYYAKAGNDKKNYTMDHSAYIYFMDTDGNFLTHFTHDADIKTIANKLKHYMEEDK